MHCSKRFKWSLRWKPDDWDWKDVWMGKHFSFIVKVVFITQQLLLIYFLTYLLISMFFPRTQWFKRLMWTNSKFHLLFVKSGVFTPRGFGGRVVTLLPPSAASVPAAAAAAEPPLSGSPAGGLSAPDSCTKQDRRRDSTRFWSPLQAREGPSLHTVGFGRVDVENTSLSCCSNLMWHVLFLYFVSFDVLL